jgi:hypothetical protein
MELHLHFATFYAQCLIKRINKLTLTLLRSNTPSWSLCGLLMTSKRIWKEVAVA